VDDIVTNVPAVQDINVGMPFFDELAKALVGSEILWKSMTIKDEAYAREQEVRLLIVGEYRNLESAEFSPTPCRLVTAAHTRLATVR
jgi:hypothetical protein